MEKPTIQAPMTHEELVLEVYRIMHKMPLEVQAAVVEK